MLIRRANTDPLTGAPNRAGLALAFAGSKNSAVTAVLIDMDHFKAVNDRHGHAAGDRLLVQLVASIYKVLSRADVVARLGGDEFVVLFKDTQEADAIRHAETLRCGFIEEIATQSQLSVSATLSIGIARPQRQLIWITCSMPRTPPCIARKKVDGIASRCIAR
ncbi:GGDEF domain-containing protein [Ochrobactrum sp. S46]|nr:GGDEF domain-containing protein [Ochrobactrum sp. S45]MBK0046235.1 GGDEF domain-containing protein [Ochrobactrum sp. S46]